MAPSRRSAVVWLALSAGASVWFACSSESFTDGTTGQDASVDGASATDGASMEAGPGDDSSATDGAHGLSGCALLGGAGRFCEDFDQGSLTLGMAIGAPPTTLIDTTHSTSPPASLSVDLTGLDSGAAELGAILKGPTRSTLAVDMQLRIDAHGAYFEPLHVLWNYPNDEVYDVYVYLYDGGSSSPVLGFGVNDQADAGTATSVDYPLGLGLYDQKFHHLRFMFDRAQSKAAASVDGTLIASTPPLPGPSGTLANTMTIRFASYGEATGGGWRVSLDDLVVDPW